MINVIYLFIKQLGISRISLRKITEAYEQHPLKSSIRCVSDVLDSFNIPNVVCQLSINQLIEIETPLLVMLHSTNDYLCIVERIDDKEIVLRTTKSRKVYTIEHFSEIWTGIVLGAENSDKIRREPLHLYCVNQFISYVDNRLYSIILALLFILGAIYITFNPINNISYLTLTLFGFVTSLLVIRKTLFDPKILDAVCRLGTQINCNDVLKSKASKLFGWLSLGEISTAYFLGILGVNLFVFTNETSFYFVISIMSICVVVLSVLWQFINRQWCTLCLLIDFVLLAQFIVIIFENNWHPDIPRTVFDFVNFSLLFSIILISLYVIRKGIEYRLKVRNLEMRHEMLLQEPWIMNELLLREKTIEPVINYNPISNKIEADNKITIITNLNCSECARLHKKLKGINNVEKNIILVNHYGDKEGENASFKIIAIMEQHGWDMAMNEMSNWFNNKRFSQEIEITKENISTLKRHIEYCEKIGVRETPSVYLNGKKMPEIYNIEDLNVFL